MVAAAVLSFVALALGVTIPQLLLIGAILNTVVAVYLYTLVPEFLLRFLAFLLVRVIYRLKVTGIDRIPEEGAVLLVCNHVSYADALVISAACPRPLRFVMEAAIFKIPVLNAIFRGMKAIPVAPAAEDRSVREAAFNSVAVELRAGQAVCIFPEGGLTRDGAIGEFRPGVARILSETPVPVVPCALGNLWDSLFSRQPGPWFKRLPGRFWSRIYFRVGAAQRPAEATPAGLREQVVALRGTAA
jgi:1-acyl-sn-glycerol-3-phosphate acyltransferase